ncbi:MAG: beta-ketoacyl-[acyl-carrier-protein] synthase family protein [Streptosporangiaceae bacterium]|nr:beta-ketoacyl-[acyl-carrier-protein] synthase family protein [Streptosporangiaceae bacterium]MBV9854007.1 beta-ketoacyl-[acyl-carrier-protein] synthase family protein [Streptosporangiaceae bacterium]
MEQVLVTGIGVVLPGAVGAEEFWKNLREGRSQIGFLTRFDPGVLPVRLAAEIKGFDHTGLLPGLPAEHAAKYTREIRIAMSAVADAMRDAGLDRATAGVDPARIGLITSSSRGPLEWWHEAMPNMDEAGPGAPFGDSGAMLRGLPGCPATMAAIHCDIRGLVTTLSSACVGGNHAIGMALHELRAGCADAMLVGGHEFPILPGVVKSYLALGDGVLSREDSDPATAMKPYDARRDGMVLGEGAVVLCLERAESARARGARAYAEVVAHRAINEASHPTTMDLSGKRTRDVILDVLAASRRGPDDIDYICGHGTATRYNDIAESRAVAALYPERPPARWPPLSSVKPVYGHCLGVSGVVNVAATALMIRHGCLVPTINYQVPDPECDHDHVSEGARRADVGFAVSLSFAFGSQTSVVSLAAA